MRSQRISHQYWQNLDAIKSRAAQLNIEMTDAQYKECTAKIKALADIRPVSYDISIFVRAKTSTDILVLDRRRWCRLDYQRIPPRHQAWKGGWSPSQHDRWGEGSSRCQGCWDWWSREESPRSWGCYSNPREGTNRCHRINPHMKWKTGNFLSHLFGWFAYSGISCIAEIWLYTKSLKVDFFSFARDIYCRDRLGDVLFLVLFVPASSIPFVCVIPRKGRWTCVAFFAFWFGKHHMMAVIDCAWNWYIIQFGTGILKYECAVVIVNTVIYSWIFAVGDAREIVTRIFFP